MRTRVRLISYTMSALLLVSLLAIGAPLPAVAQEVHTFDISSQDSASAIRAFSEQSGMQILASADDLHGKHLNAIHGNVANEEALNDLLAGTGLSHRYVGGRTVALVSATSATDTAPPLHSPEALAGIQANTADSKDSSAGQLRLAQVAPGTSATSTAAAGSAGANAESSGSANQMEQIIVTAQKREERLQDVPVPVTAINTQELTQNNQTRLQDYYATVPGLSISPSVESRQRVSIRGITTGGTSNPTVGVTVDGVSFGSSTEIGGSSVIPDIDPSDLSRIEVLRGPQGTLYGASSLGGLINFVTVDPSTSRLSGRLEAGTSSVYNGAELGYSVRGAVNVPLSDTLAIRASAFVREDPGYIDNPVRNIDGINKSTAEGGHFSTLWQPSQDFSLKLSALLQEVKGDGTSDVDAQPGLGDLQQNYPPGVGAYERKVQAYSATFKVKLGGGIDFTSVTGYNSNTNNSSWDYSYALGSLIEAHYGVPAAPVFENNSTGKFSQEFRLSGQLGEKFEWLLGGFYTDESSHYQENIVAEDPATGGNVGEFASLIFPTRYKEYAGFADLTYHFTDQFDVQVGARESKIKQNFAESITGLYDSVLLKQPSPVVYPAVDIDNNAFTYLVTPRFKISPDFMVYARLASGYRAGGGNAAAIGVTSVPREYNPDKTHDYEVGAKADFFDHRISVDSSVFYILWDQIQLPLRDPATHLSYTGNGGQAKSQGIELSVEFKPVEHLTIATWVSWDEAVLTQALPTTSTVTGASGARLPNTSRLSGNFSVNEEFPIAAELRGFVGGTLSYVGDRVGVFTASPNRQNLPGYAQTNLNAGVKYDSWTFNGYLNNALDRRGLLDGGLDMFPTFAYVYIQPRTVGISIAKSF
jgi:iron complex outermembrane receptor protein